MQLTLDGLKAKPRSLTLDKLNLVLGPNGIGKTSIPAALQVLLLGYLPSLGKRPLDTAALMSDGKLDVSLTLDDGRTLQRSFRKKGKSVERSAEASWLRQATPAEHDAEILGLAGREEPEAIQNLTIKALIDASPSQKATVIEGILASGKKTPQEIVLRVAHLTVQRITGLDDDRMPKNYQLALPSLKDGEGDALKQAAGMLTAKITDSGIPGAITWANESKNSAAKSLKDKTAAKGELEARLGDCPDAPQAEIDRLEDEKAQVQKELGAAQERGEQMLRRRDALAQAMNEVAVAETGVKRAKMALAEAEDLPANLHKSGRGRELKVIEVLLKEVQQTPPSRPSVDEVDRLLEQAQAKMDTLGELKTEPIPGLTTEKLELEAIVQQAEQMGSTPWPRVREIGRNLKRFADDRVSGYGEELAQIADKELGGYDHEAQNEAFKQARKALEDAGERQKATVARNSDILTQRQKIKDAATLLHEQAVDLRNRNEASYREKHAAWVDQVNSLTQERDDLLNAIRKAEQAQAEASTRLEAAKARHEAAAKRLKELEQGTDVQVVSTDALEAKAGDLNDRLDALRDVAGRRHAYAELIAEIDKAQAERDTYAAIEYALQRVRETELNDASAPLLDRIKKFLKAAGRVETPYLDANKTDVEIGWKDKDQRKVAVQVMSGAEQALFTTALAAAVIAIRKPPLKILIVEGGEVRADQLAPLMAGIKAVSDDLDLALILYPHDTPPVDGDWNVVRLK